MQFAVTTPIQLFPPAGASNDPHNIIPDAPTGNHSFNGPVLRPRRLQIPSKRPFSTASKGVRCHRILTSYAKFKLPIKDLEVRDSGPGLEFGGDVHFSAPIKPRVISTTKKEEDERQEFYVNTGYAIRTLREECPQLFCRELSFDIYRDDIVFKTPLNSFAGINNYKSIFWALRFHSRIFFKTIWFDIISIWQPIESIIMVRWTVHGIPRVPWETTSRGRFDGISEYKLDQKGKIYEHRVYNIALNGGSPKFRILALEDLVQSLGCPSTPKPTYFEISPNMLNLESAEAKFAWVKDCLVSRLGFMTKILKQSQGQ